MSERVNPNNPLWKADPVPVVVDGTVVGQRWESVDSHTCAFEDLDPREWVGMEDFVRCAECGMFDTKRPDGEKA
jgi:hypothetical protein